MTLPHAILSSRRAALGAATAVLVLAAPGCVRSGTRATAVAAPQPALEPLASRASRLSHARPAPDEQLRVARAIVDHLGAVHADVGARLLHERRAHHDPAVACLRDQFTVIDAARQFAVEHQSRLRLAVVRANETERFAEFDYLALLAGRADAIRSAAARCTVADAL